MEEARANGIGVGELLTIVGLALYRTGKLSASIEPLEQAIEELQAEGSSAVAARLMLGRTYADLHEIDAAHRYLEEAQEEARILGDARKQVEALGHLAAMWYAQSSDLQAEKALTEAIAMAREIGFRLGEGNNLTNLASVHLDRGRAGHALALLDQAAEAYKSLDDRRGQAFVKMDRSWLLHWYVGDDVEAEREATEAAVQFRDFGDSRTEIVCQYVIAGAERRMGRRRHARKRLGDTLRRAADTEDPRSEVRLLFGLALVDLSLDQSDAAVDHLTEAQRLCRAHDLEAFVAILLALEARARLLGDEPAEASALVERAIRANGPTSELAYLAAWWCAESLRQLDRHEEASEQVALAHDLLSRGLDGLPDHLVESAWTSVPEHQAILAARDEYFIDRGRRDDPVGDGPDRASPDRR